MARPKPNIPLPAGYTYDTMLEALSGALVDAGVKARVDFPDEYVRVDRIKRTRGWDPHWVRVEGAAADLRKKRARRKRRLADQ